MVMAQHQARPAADGDGVKLKRVFGGANLETFDPFLMMDEFGSAEADDYIGGFPAHPHRGFETITYMLQGRMEHQDHLGNRGLLTDGGVQWMTAGKGIIHSEMPKQTEGLMRGFQIWLNLPAKDKMQIAHYEDVSPAQIPRLTTE
jgi:redox-sensitive bicupin YhaK (pirin superfamily)